MTSTPVLVATCGNADAADDAFGPRVGRALRRRALTGVEVIDLDIKPTALLDHLPGPGRLVLVDAARVEESAPDDLLIVDLGREPLPALLNDDALSSHGLGLADQIALARQVGILPAEVLLVAAPLTSATVGGSPRDDLDRLVESAVRYVVGLLAAR